MSNSYRAVSDRARALYGEDTLVLDLGTAEELDALAGGHLEIVPRRYLVLADNFADAPQGATYEAAYPVDRETALLAGGVLERVPDEDTDPVPPEGDPGGPSTDDKPAATKTTAKTKTED